MQAGVHAAGIQIPAAPRVFKAIAGRRAAR
jgi:hypothetical protein